MVHGSGCIVVAAKFLTLIFSDHVIGKLCANIRGGLHTAKMMAQIALTQIAPTCANIFVSMQRVCIRYDIVRP